MQLFDVQRKTWKALSSVAQLSEPTAFNCAECVGNHMYVAAKRGDDFVNYSYHIVDNTWETLPSFAGLANQISCFCSVDDHLYALYQSGEPYRYHIATNQWQRVANSKAKTNMPEGSFCNGAAVVYRSYLYVLYGRRQSRLHSNRRSCWTCWESQVADLFCFEPKRNKWEQKASTSTCHFGSSLFVVNDKLYVAGGKCSVDSSNGEISQFSDDIGKVEVYDEQNNTWSVVDQPHIPPNSLGAVEVEHSVYFIVNNFPVDSGIRILPGELYHVPLDEWENLGKVAKNAILCYLPIKTENLPY